MSTNTISTIPFFEFEAITQTNSSPETVAALLNEAERKYSSLLKKSHGNAKRIYPFWKTCLNCSKPFPALTKEQAIRNKSCGSECSATLIGAANSGASPVETHAGKAKMTCAVCGTEFYRNAKHVARVAVPTCSRQCNGALRGAEWKTHAHKGHVAWSASSTTALKERFTGPSNPSWKGGVTYRRRRGNYVSVRYVRCPPEYAAMARTDGYVMEHRLVVARHLGRALSRAECVHHINHDPLDNRLENLMLFASNQDHKLFEGGAAITPIWQP
jgi:hypothetical protein